MAHAVFIAAHAASGLIAFAAGCAAVSRGRYFTLYFWSLISLVVFLAAAVAVDWPGLEAPSRILYVALTGLGGYVIVRAVQARRLLPASPAQRSGRYLDHLGFTLVALFDGFVVITVLDLGAPGWLVAAIGLFAAGVGHVAIRMLKAGTLRPQHTASITGAQRPAAATAVPTGDARPTRGNVQLRS